MSQLSDPIADFLTRLRNSSSSRQQETSAPYSKMKAEIARILKREGYITDFEVDTTGDHPLLKVRNKYVGRSPALTGLRRISRPGLRRYVGAGDVPRVLGGMGISILSTSQGIMTGREAKQNNVGGELLAYVW